MYFEFNEEQRMLRQSTVKLFNEFFPIEEVRGINDEHKISKDFLRKLCKLGMIGSLANENAGGMDLSVVDSIPIFIEAGRFLVPFPLLENILGVKLLSEYYPQKAESVINGEKLVTISWGSHGYGVVKDGSGEIHGDFQYIPFAGESDWLIAPVKLTNFAFDTYTIALIDLKSDDVSIEKIKSIDLTYPLYKVRVNSYKVNHEDIIGEVLKGEEIFFSLKELASLFLCAEMYGASEKALLNTLDYTKERVQFNQPIAKFQAIKHIAADNYLICQSQRNSIEYAAWACDQKQDEKQLAIAVANSYVKENAILVAQNALQLLGGIGFTWEHELHFYLKRIVRSSSTLGNTYDHTEKLASMILDNAYISYSYATSS